MLNTLKFALMMIALAGCGQAPTDFEMPDESPQAQDDRAPAAAGIAIAAAPAPAPSASPSPAPTIALTYYSRTITIASATINGTPTSIQGTGMCAQYLGATYCWDDGIKTLAGGGYTYWGLKIHTDTQLRNCPSMYGHCVNDRLLTPTTMTANVIGKLNTVVGSAHRTVAEVLAATAATVSCTETGGVLDCGIFAIDLNQVLL